MIPRKGGNQVCDNDDKCKKVVWTITPDPITTYSLAASRPRDPSMRAEDILAGVNAEAQKNKGQDEDTRCKGTNCHCADNGPAPEVTTDNYVAEFLWSEQVITHVPGKPDTTEWFAYGATASYTLTCTETIRRCMPNRGHVDGGKKDLGEGKEVYIRSVRPGSHDPAVEVFTVHARDPQPPISRTTR